MAKKQTAQVQQATVSVARQKTMDNRKARLERHLKKFPNDSVAKEALKHENPARTKSKVKGSYPKQKFWVRDEGSGFKREQFKLTFATLEYFVPKADALGNEVLDKHGRVEMVINPVISSEWSKYKDEISRKIKEAQAKKAAESRGEKSGRSKQRGRRTQGKNKNSTKKA